MISKKKQVSNTAVEVARYSLGLIDVVMGYISKMMNPRDPEDLHQFRVHLRKLRSILLTYDVLFPKKELTFFIRRIEELAEATNIARDLDVHQEILEQEINAVSPAYRIGLRTLRNKWKIERHNVQQQMIEIISLRQRDGFFNALINWLASFTEVQSRKTSDIILDKEHLEEHSINDLENNSETTESLDKKDMDQQATFNEEEEELDG